MSDPKDFAVGLFQLPTIDLGLKRRREMPPSFLPPDFRLEAAILDDAAKERLKEIAQLFNGPATWERVIEELRNKFSKDQ
jgi:hypothetical protein